MIYDDYFKNIIGGNINSPEYYVSTYENKTYEPRQVNTLPGYSYSSTNDDFEDDKILELYPDIYRVVSPMVDKLLDGKDTNNISESMLVNWTVEIYDALETDEVVSKSTLNNNGNVLNTNNPNSVTTNKLNSYANQNTTTNLNQRTNNSLNNNLRNNQNLNSNSLNNQSGTYESETTSAKNIVKNNITDSRNVNNSDTVLTNTEPKVVDVVSRYRNYRNPILRDLIRILILNRIYGNNRPTRPNLGPRPRPYQDFRPTFSPIPNYNEVNTEVFKPYTNYSKTYFDTPYPEEG